LILVGVFYAGFTYASISQKLETISKDIIRLDNVKANKELTEEQFESIDDKLNLILKIIDEHKK